MLTYEFVRRGPTIPSCEAHQIDIVGKYLGCVYYWLFAWTSFSMNQHASVYSRIHIGKAA